MAPVFQFKILKMLNTFEWDLKLVGVGQWRSRNFSLKSEDTSFCFLLIVQYLTQSMIQLTSALFSALDFTVYFYVLSYLIF